MYFRYFFIISHWKGAWPFIWTKLQPLHSRMHCARFGRKWPSGSGEEDENVKSLRQRRQRQRRWQRRTTDKFWSGKLTWAIGSGKLKCSYLLVLQLHLLHLINLYFLWWHPFWINHTSNKGYLLQTVNNFLFTAQHNYYNRDFNKYLRIFMCT